MNELDIPHYERISLHRTLKKKNTRKESGGLTVYYKSSLNKYIELVQTDSDDIVWIKLKPDNNENDKDIFMCVCYVVPSESSRQELIELNAIDRIERDIALFESQREGGQQYVLCGDFNDRTNTKPDFVEFDTEEYLPLASDYTTDYNIPRYSQDNKPVNDYGHKLLQLCIWLRIANGRIGDDKGVGKFTCVKHNGSSVVDYVVCAPELFTRITRFVMSRVFCLITAWSALK